MSERDRRDTTDTYVVEKAERAHDRLDEHEEVHQRFDRRISTNENWRLQAQGALKVIGIILGAGGLAVAIDWFVGLL